MVNFLDPERQLGNDEVATWHSGDLCVGDAKVGELQETGQVWNCACMWGRGLVGE